EAARLSPESYEIRNNVGNMLDKLGRPQEALAEYREAVRLKPDKAVLHNRLGQLLAELGCFDKAINEFAEAARLDPGDPHPYYLMGMTLLMQDHDAEAVGRFREALRLDPNDLPTLIFLARALASSENPQIRNGAEAVALADKANALTGGGQPLVLEILAMSCAEDGRF